VERKRQDFEASQSEAGMGGMEVDSEVEMEVEMEGETEGETERGDGEGDTIGFGHFVSENSNRRRRGEGGRK